MIGREAGKSYAYLVGVFLGDGCVSRDKRGYQVFRLNTIDEDFALAVSMALKDCGAGYVGIRRHSVEKGRDNYALSCCYQEISTRLVIDTAGKTRLPVFSSDEETKAMIVGLMDSEGFVAEKTQNKTGRAYYMGFKSCDVWVPDFISAVQSVGLKIGKIQTEEPYKAGYKAPTRFHIKMQSWVDSGMRFNIKRKQDRADRWAATVPYSERSRYPRKLTSETSTPEARQG